MNCVLFLSPLTVKNKRVYCVLPSYINLSIFIIYITANCLLTCMLYYTETERRNVNEKGTDGTGRRHDPCHGCTGTCLRLRQRYVYPPGARESVVLLRREQQQCILRRPHQLLRRRCVLQQQPCIACTRLRLLLIREAATSKNGSVRRDYLSEQNRFFVKIRGNHRLIRITLPFVMETSSVSMPIRLI